ncbi:MAG: polysaccharide biosynthesis protein [Rhodospirillales bacterium 20-60-12]|nr:MAG: polysaccharide biosynthesis protein [Rhodospirillales bacterium 20-60-12]HQT68229.1 oligosaccharide flippase family protein [Acetobacteraceae bacterium]
MNVARGAAHGALWNFLTVLFERGFGFIILAVLIRHVSIADVGLVAIGSAISELSRMIATGGTGEQVIASPGDRMVEAGAFWAQFLVSLVFALALIGAAPFLAILYHEPRLVWIIRALSFNIILGCFLIVPSARLAQNFRFRALSTMSVGSTLLGGIVALYFAFHGQGVLALILQRMVGIGFYAVAVASMARWLPPRPPAFAVLRRSMLYNLPMMGAAFVDYIAMTGYVVLVGLRMSVIDVGRFRIAQRLAEVLQEVTIMPVSKVFLPVFVRVREDVARRYATAMQLCDAVALLSLAAAATAGAVAHPLVVLMFGPRWAEAAPLFSIMTLMVPAVALYAFVNPMLTALGRPNLVYLFAALNALTIAAAAWFAAPFGLHALAWALAGRGVIAGFFLLPAISLGLGGPAGPLFRLFAAPLLAMLVARVAALLVLSLLGPIPLPVALVVGLGISGLFFAGTLLLIARPRITAITRRVSQAVRG